MPVTIDNVKADIKSGKCKRIYYSSGNLWWTHLDEDVTESTAQGKKAQEHKLKKIKESSAPEEEKQKMIFLHDKIKDSTIPLDPSGAPLFFYDDPIKWITEAESKPEFFGKHKLDAFMKSHHQNCGGRLSPRWDTYNDLIDNIKLESQ